MKGGHRPFPDQFSTPLRKVLKAVSIGPPNVVGSAGDHQVMYSADYDLMEAVALKSTSAKTFQALVKRTQKVATITDIKCGEVQAWNLLTGEYDREAEVKHLGQLWQDGILTEGEVQEAKKLLKEHLTVPEKLRARKELRFGVLRWTPAEVYAGHKTFRKHTFYLEDAFKSTGITKVDAVAWVNDKYIEVSNIILWHDGKKQFAQTKPLKDALAEDILLYEDEENWVKVAKRMLENRRTAFVFGDEIVDAVASRCTEVDSGARNIDNILTNTLMPEMSKELLGRMAVGEQINEIKVGLDGDGFTFAVS